MPVRVTGPEGNGFFSSFVSALEYAVVNGADIVNMSLEANALPNTVRETVSAAHEAGVIMVAAAGNSGFGVTFPASLEDIIAVGATRGVDEPDLRDTMRPGAQPGGPAGMLGMPGEPGGRPGAFGGHGR